MMKHKQNYMYSNKVNCKIHSNTNGNHHNYSCSHLHNHLYKCHCMKNYMNWGMWPNKMPYMPWNNCCNFPSEYSYKCCCSWLYILPYNWNRNFQNKYWRIPYRNFRYNFQNIPCSSHHYKSPSSCCRSLRYMLWNRFPCNSYRLQNICLRILRCKRQSILNIRLIQMCQCKWSCNLKRSWLCSRRKRCPWCSL